MPPGVLAWRPGTGSHSPMLAMQEGAGRWAGHHRSSDCTYPLPSPGRPLQSTCLSGTVRLQMSACLLSASHHRPQESPLSPQYLEPSR